MTALPVVPPHIEQFCDDLRRTILDPGVEFRDVLDAEVSADLEARRRGTLQLVPPPEDGGF